MTNPCPRCAELEARLQNFEKETFEKLRERVRELEYAVLAYYLGRPSFKTVELAKKTFESHSEEPENAAPTGNPTTGGFMWIDTDGRAWIRTNEGNVYPHPLLKDEK